MRARIRVTVAGGVRLEVTWESICLAVVLGVQERGTCIYRVMQEGRSMCWEVVVTAVVT